MDFKLPCVHEQVFQTALFYIFVERQYSCCIFMSRLYYRYISVNHEELPWLLEAGVLCLNKHLLQHLFYFIGSVITLTFWKKKTLKPAEQLSFTSFRDSLLGVATMKASQILLSGNWCCGAMAILIPSWFKMERSAKYKIRICSVSTGIGTFSPFNFVCFSIYFFVKVFFLLYGGLMFHSFSM